MSILIKGMEMPQNCISCRFCKAYMASTDSKNYKEYFYCRVLDKVKGENDCPLIEVPKHGRLIDADALPHYVPDVGYLSMEQKIFNDVIANAPTIIEAEEGET